MVTYMELLEQNFLLKTKIDDHYIVLFLAFKITSA